MRIDFVVFSVQLFHFIWKIRYKASIGQLVLEKKMEVTVQSITKLFDKLLIIPATKIREFIHMALKLYVM